MSSELTKFDPSKIGDALKDKIKGEILNVIPPEVWKAMIDEQVKRMFQPSVGDDYHRSTVEPEITTMIRTALKTQLLAEMAKYFETPEWKNSWNGDGTIDFPAGVRKLAKEVAPAMIEGLSGTLVSLALNAFRYQIQQASQGR